MTVCGLLRMDGEPARRSLLTAMLATSSTGLPSARGIHVDGPFGVAAAADTPDAVPPIAVDASGLTVVLGGRLPVGRPTASLVPVGHPAGSATRRPRGPRGLAGADGTDACVFLAAYRDDPARRLDLLGGDWLALVWEPESRRLVCARASGLSRDLLTWTDGKTLVFGTEVAQLVTAGMPAPARPSRRPAGVDRAIGPRPTPAQAPGAVPRLSSIRVLRAGERLTIRLRG
jgi:hypothetical protein